MVSSCLENLVFDHKFSSVTTSRARSEAEVRDLTNIDLAMKLHYIKALYFFNCDAAQGLDIYALKVPMFEWLDLYYPVSGRIRRSENGLPFIKCNDGGVRIIEAKCNKSVDEWLGLNDRTVDDQLMKEQVLGPELGFSPLVFLQFTSFKCGGLSVGLSWAHVLGDYFTASTFINMWAHIMSPNQVPRYPLTLPNNQKYQKSSLSSKPTSLNKIDPVGDTWLVPNTQKMETHSFHVTKKVLQKLEKDGKTFLFVTALFWKSISKVRDYDTKVVTICNKGSELKENKVPNNSQLVGTVETDFSTENVGLFDLAKWIEEEMVDERSVIEDYVTNVSGKFDDFVFYGANLTFVNLEEVNLYGLELHGKKPLFANMSVTGVGEEGVVLVLPRPNEDSEAGRMVTVTLPGNQMIGLKDILSKEWGIY